MMNKAVRIVGSSLILLAFGAAIPTVWAAGAASAKTQFSVPVQTADNPPAPHVLDLKAPDVKDVMTPDEMASILATPDEFDVIPADDTVAVHGATFSPYVPSGFGALYWATLHPFSAWRILTPVQ